MTVGEFSEMIGASVACGRQGLQKEIKGIYCGDLLSRVMAKTNAQDAWITIHNHMNIVAVAVLNELACIIVPEDVSFEGEPAEKAEEEGVTVLCTALTAYEICCKAAAAGI